MLESASNIGFREKLSYPLLIRNSIICWAGSAALKKGDSLSISHLKCRAILWPGFPAIIEAGCGNIGMPQPLLHLSDISLVIQGIGGGRGPQGVHAQPLNIANPNFPRILLHHPIHAVCSHCLIEPTVGIVLHRPEEGRAGIPSMPQGFNIRDCLGRPRTRH